MKRNALIVWLNVALVVGTVAMNILANALPLNGQNTGEISDRFKVLFVPAGYVFSIWGLIYIGLIAYGVYQALPAQRENPRLARADSLFIIASVANVAWLFFWHYNLFLLTLVAMLTLLASLIGIYLVLGIGRGKVSRAEQWAVRVPFSVYLGWISVATIANVTDVLDFVGWNGWGLEPAAWAAIMLGVGVILAALMAFTRHDVAYVLVFVWAYIGIALKQASTPLLPLVAWPAVVALLMLAVSAVVGARRQANPAPAR
jgi:TspO/MBR family